jgi:hypothetical protein
MLLVSLPASTRAIAKMCMCVLALQVSSAPWVQALDFIGVDCYFTPPLPPWSGPGGLQPSDFHPPLPWQDLNLTLLLEAQAKLMPPFAALSAATGGKRIVCTEVGWASRPWAYGYRAGQPRLDAEDCSVSDQCISPVAQGLAYQALLQVRGLSTRSGTGFFTKRTHMHAPIDPFPTRLITPSPGLTV